MSVTETRWAWNQHGLSASEKMVLLAMADMAENWQAWPSITTLCSWTDYARPTVISAIRGLVTKGLLQPGKKRFRSSLYVLVQSMNHSDIKQRFKGFTSSSNEPVQSMNHDGKANEPITVHAMNHIGSSNELYPPLPTILPTIDPSAPQEKQKRKSRGVTEITPEFRESMYVRFAPSFGGRQAVDERIKEALAHTASKKYTDQQAYVTGWLRRDSERAGLNGYRRTSRVEATHGPEDFKEGW